MVQALGELTKKGLGCLLVVDAPAQRLLGTFTDGDLRRTLQGRGAQVCSHGTTRLEPLLRMVLHKDGPAHHGC